MKKTGAKFMVVLIGLVIIFQDSAYQSGNHNFRENYQRVLRFKRRSDGFSDDCICFCSQDFCVLSWRQPLYSQKKHLSRDRVDMAVYSVFGEYEKNYGNDIVFFGIDIGYESGAGSEQTIENRIRYYGALDFAFDFEALQLLTDHQGRSVLSSGSAGYKFQIWD